MKFKLEEIKKTEIYISNQTVYDLTVEDDHSYCVGEEAIIVHNSACKTRMVTGIGYPQFSAILECGKVAEDHGGMICSDGGCSSSGDIAKAFAGGANWVMLGNMLAGHTESEMQCVNGEYDFYGMSSDKAMNKYSHKHIYRASEGHELKIKAKGSVASTIQEIMGGLRSACTYVGAKDLIELYHKSNFILVNRGK